MSETKRFLTSYSNKKRRYRIINTCPYSRDDRKYRKLKKIGCGNYGTIYRGVNYRDRTKFMMMKRIFTVSESENFSINTRKEIQMLEILRHENVVNFIEIWRTWNGEHRMNRFYQVFEFCEHNLADLLASSQITINSGEAKNILKQLLEGVKFIHDKNIIHSNLKPSNILVTRHGVVKVSNFATAKFLEENSTVVIDPDVSVVNLWYRSPELLLVTKSYGAAVDVWSIGCVLGELWTREPILPGSSFTHQLFLISELCGSINPEVWPNVAELAFYDKIWLSTCEKRTIKECFLKYAKDSDGCDLLEQFLILDPSKRISAEAALLHDFFKNEPAPCELSNIVGCSSRMQRIE